MNQAIQTISNGSVTTPKGFRASGVPAGIKKSGNPDLGILVSQVRCPVAGVFTKNVLKGASLLITKEHLSDRYAQAVVVNSGNANACTGERGLLDAQEISRYAGRLLKIPAHDVLPSSTGVIGEYLPLPAMREGIERAIAALSEDGGPDMARAIMTTDTKPKHSARTVSHDGHTFSLGGIAKGAGMIHPNMATMLVYITTDARVHPESLQTFLKHACDKSFNRFTIDGDTSCDDTVLLMANGLSDSTEITDDGSALSNLFLEALTALCRDLTYQLASDGEGVTKVATIHVQGAQTKEQANQIARAIAVSPLVKTAFYGEDPNWGRIINAAGYSGADFDPTKTDLWIGDIQTTRNGERTDYKEDDAHNIMKNKQFEITLHLNQGTHSDFYITTDFSNQYVDINADYRHRT